ncbi:methyl-accepting chemotaxis protein [Anaeromicropila populeti]|nr:methyl-accepting chemotaxis protein [Anaeromicropila populeti]
MQFNKDSYFMVTNSMCAKEAASQIQQYIYKSLLTEKEAMQKKYVEEAEKEYQVMVHHLQLIYTSSDSIKSITKESKKTLEQELEKAVRYREKILKAADRNDMENVLKIYKNDYAPILTTITKTLDDVILQADKYAALYMDTSEMQMGITIILFLLLSTGGVVSGIYLCKKTTKSIIEPLKEIEQAMIQVSKGNLEVIIQHRSKDELGVLCSSVRKMVQNLKQYIEDITTTLKKIEEKDIAFSPKYHYVGSFVPIQTSLERICCFIAQMLNQINDSSSQIASASNELSNVSFDIVEGANEQTRSVNKLFGHVDKICNEVMQTKERSANLSDRFSDTVYVVQRGRENMGQLKDCVKKLDEKSKEIHSIIIIIEEITRQTKLVALNASIEAARAGIHGKEFNVVASEIQKLALNCAKAANDTKRLLCENLNIVTECVEVTNRTEDDLEQIKEVCGETDVFVNAITKACISQNAYVDRMRKHLDRISDISNSNQSAAEESYAVSRDFSQQTHNLQSIVESFVKR